jgi:hypothetical protein
MQVLVLEKAYASDLERFDCSFDKAVTSDLNKENFKNSTDKMDVSFVVVSEKKAIINGNAGSTEVLLSRNAEAANFLEKTRSGNFILTSVYTYGDTGHKKSYPAVQSRHIAMLKTPIVSQYIGSCEIK